MKRFLSILGISLAGTLLLAAPTALIWIPHWFLNHEAFRQVMNQQTSQVLQMNGEWMPFRLKGWTLTSDGYEGSGFREGCLIHLRAETISFRINWRALLKRKWYLDPIEVQKINIRIEPSKKESASAKEPPPSPSCPRIAALYLLPRRVEIHQILIAQASIDWKDQSNQTYRIHNLKVRTISLGQGLWSTSLSSGTFTPPRRQEWDLNSARLVGNSNRMDLDHAEWYGKDAGVFRMSGPLLASGKLKPLLEIKAVGIPLHSLVPENWSPFFEGVIDGEASMDYSSGALHLKGTAKGRNVRLVGIPVLRSLQLATGIEEWTQLPLQTAQATFNYQNDLLTVSSSVFESSGILRMEGQFNLRHKALNGLYEVGLCQKAVKRIPAASDTVFTKRQSGNDYLWAHPPMKLSGTMENPKEDLSPRLKLAVMDAVEQKVNQGIQIFKSLLNQLP